MLTIMLGVVQGRYSGSVELDVRFSTWQSAKVGMLP